MKTIVTARFLDDLRAITLHIWEQRPDSTLRFFSACTNSIRHVGQFPLSGRRLLDVPNLPHEYRIASVTGFRNDRIYNLVEENMVHIVRNLHSARDLGAILDKET